MNRKLKSLFMLALMLIGLMSLIGVTQQARAQDQTQTQDDEDQDTNDGSGEQGEGQADDDPDNGTEDDTMPILMLTARDAVDDRVKGLEIGADDYLVKPFHLKELRARVRALLPRSQGEASNTVEVGRLKLDLEKKQSWWQEAQLELSGREYALLEFLVLHAGGFYTREQLLEHVWSGEASIDSRTVDTYILYLRRKLASDAIETVRNLGYTFRG